MKDLRLRYSKATHWCGAVGLLLGLLCVSARAQTSEFVFKWPDAVVAMEPNGLLIASIEGLVNPIEKGEWHVLM